MGCASSTDSAASAAAADSPNAVPPAGVQPHKQKQPRLTRAQLRDFYDELDRNPAHAPALWVAPTSLLAAHLAQATAEAESYRSAESGGVEADEPPADDIARRQVKARAAAFFHHGIDGDPEQFADAIRNEQAAIDERALHLPADVIVAWREAVEEVDAQSHIIELVTPPRTAGSGGGADERSLAGTPQSPGGNQLLRPSASVSWIMPHAAANAAYPDFNATSQRSFNDSMLNTSQIMIEVSSPPSGAPTPKQHSSFPRSPNSYQQPPARTLSSSGRHRSPSSLTPKASRNGSAGSALTAQALAQLPSLRCPAAAHTMSS